MFYVNDEQEGKFLYTDTIKLYCIVLYFSVLITTVLLDWTRIGRTIAMQT